MPTHNLPEVDPNLPEMKSKSPTSTPGAHHMYDLYKIGVAEEPYCRCGETESCEHYLMEGEELQDLSYEKDSGLRCGNRQAWICGQWKYY